MTQSEFNDPNVTTVVTSATLLRNMHKILNKHGVLDARDRRDLQNLMFLIIDDAQSPKARPRLSEVLFEKEASREDS
jgi:hypothetical protein